MSSKIGLTGVAILFVLATLAACGGGGGGGNADDSAAAPPPNNVAGFAYVMDLNSGQVAGSRTDVSAYTINASTGALSQAAGSPHAAMPPNNVAGVAYVANSDDVSAYTINASTSALAGFARRLWITIGRAMSINAYAAALAQAAGSTIAAGFFAIPSTVDPSGKFAYVVNYADDNVSAYAFDAATGAFSEVAGSPFGAGTSPYSSRFLTVDPSGKFAYVTNLRAVSVYAINASTGALSEIAGSPFAVGLGVGADVAAVDVSVEPSGKFAYVASQGDNIWAYALNASTGALSEISGSPFATGPGSNPSHVTFDPLGRFAYGVHSGGAASILAYTINGATGALSQVAGSPFAVPAFPNAPGFQISFDPLGRFAYVVSDNARNYSTNTVAAYAINASTGALSEVPGSPFSARTYPQSVTVDPSGKFAYVANRFSANVSAYTIHASTGGLSEVAGSPFAAGTFPESVRVDPSGKFAYVANSDSGNVSAYTIDASTGALSEVVGSPFAAGGSPVNLTISRAMK